jgi:hypothetical protein
VILLVIFVAELVVFVVLVVELVVFVVVLVVFDEAPQFGTVDAQN